MVKGQGLGVIKCKLCVQSQLGVHRMHAGRDEVKAYQSQLSLLPSAGRERVRAKVGDAPWLGSSVGQLVNKAAFTPNSFSERPNQFCENRKTGWDWARTCNFGNIMSLVRCQFVHTQFSQHVHFVLIACTVRPKPVQIAYRFHTVQARSSPV